MESTSKNKEQNQIPLCPNSGAVRTAKFRCSPYLQISFDQFIAVYFVITDKVRDTKMMMNTVCRIYLLFIVRNLKYVQVE